MGGRRRRRRRRGWLDRREFLLQLGREPVGGVRGDRVGEVEAEAAQVGVVAVVADATCLLAVRHRDDRPGHVGSMSDAEALVPPPLTGLLGAGEERALVGDDRSAGVDDGRLLAFLHVAALARADAVAEAMTQRDRHALAVPLPVSTGRAWLHEDHAVQLGEQMLAGLQRGQCRPVDVRGIEATERPRRVEHAAQHVGV